MKRICIILLFALGCTKELSQERPVTQQWKIKAGSVAKNGSYASWKDSVVNINYTPLTGIPSMEYQKKDSLIYWEFIQRL